MADDDNAAEMVDNLNARNGNFLCGVVEGFYGRPWTPEQRKDLFVKMNKMGLNAYVYAPKDDCKHRAYWRELYSVEEAEHLTSLIQAATENGVTFYYALSPGLDITYSSAKEVTSLKRKLEQVAQFGCKAFSLLFDDIEPEMGDADKEVFQSFAHAQVSVTNEIYQHLSQPKFLFCPTEYSASRAIPSVEVSEYLSTIGSKLLPGIDIMWTGAKVITKTISVQSIEQLTEVLKRPPVIWDNIHANDYDQKRVFLGPFSGRSPDLIPHLHGVLLNPNCEYEANFIPIHTLAEWSRCSVDGKRDLTLNESISADIKLETESENGSVEDIPSRLGPNTYHPRKALKHAINEWLPEFARQKSAHGKVVKPQVPANLLPPSIATCMLGTTTTNTTTTAVTGISNVNQLQALVEVATDSAFQPVMNPVMNSLVSATQVVAAGDEPLEPMDCNPTPGSSPKCPESHMEHATSNGLANGVPLKEEGDAKSSPDKDSLKEEDTMQTDTDSTAGKKDDRQITVEDVAILVDLFYLPFEHGPAGLQLMQDFQWLKMNSNVVIESKIKMMDAATKLQNSPSTEDQHLNVDDWFRRAAKFDELVKGVSRMVDRFTYIPNRCLLYDLYPYIWDIRGVITLMNSYVKWLALGHVPQTGASFVQGSYTWFTTGWKEAFMNGEQEPWVFRGGLTAELQRLLPLENVNDLYMWKAPDVPTTRTYTIRPYLPGDQAAVFDVCRKTCDDGMDGSDVFPDHPELIGDKSVGGFLTFSPEFCFIVEDENEVVGYAVAALDAKQFFAKMEIAWIPEMCSKYPEIKKDHGEMLTPSEEIINSFRHYKPVVPETLHKLHPSIVKLNLLPAVTDLSTSKLLLLCTMSSLKANGSFGAFVEVNRTDKYMQEFYGKLGFVEINLMGAGPEEVMYLGRVI